MKMYLIELAENDIDEEDVIFENAYNIINKLYPNSNIITFYRSDGYKNNSKAYVRFMNENKEKDNIIITNDETMLNYMSHELFDNNGLNLFIYYPNTKEIKKASDLTEKDLRPAHNLVKLYYGGVFDRS